MPRNRISDLLGVLALGLTLGLTLGQAEARESSSSTQNAEITVHKTPWCGCCSDWVAHLQENGLSVTVVEQRDLTRTRASLHVPTELASCHTAEVAGYSIEGHVPAGDIRRLLLERPDGVRGLAVPGMPLGSPGMEVGGRSQPYDVIAFGDGERRVYARYRP
jgi:hypothetical protein